MTYQDPTSLNATGIEEVMTYLNTITQGWFSNLTLIAIYLIVISGYYKAQNDFAGAIAVAGFTVWVLSLLMWMGNWINGVTMGIVTGLAIVSVIIILVERSQN